MTKPEILTASASQVGCPSADDLNQLSLGTLPADAWESVSRHVESCSSCAARLQSLADSTDDLVATLRGLKGTEVMERDAALEREITIVAASGAAPPSVTELFPIGTHLHEYRLEQLIGQGGMGAVFRVVHTRLDKVLALKVLAPGRSQNREAITRFQREMKAVGKLSHPNLIQATDAGEAQGAPFLVMEFVDGVNLARLLDAHGPLPIADACELARQTALGLAEIHAQGLVHRDIKPSNLILTRAGVVKVLDLGLALLRESPVEEATSANTVLGSFDYMAPEQGEHAHSVTRAADLYSLGCTLYHLLTGWPPFPSPHYQSPMQKLKAHQSAEPASLREVRPEIPATLAALVDSMMAKDPSRRPESAADVATALAPHAQRCDLTRLLDAEATLVVAKAPPAPRKPRRTNRLAWIVGLLGAIGIILLGIVVIVIQTDNGTLEIRSDDKEVKVIVERAGELVTIVDLKTEKKTVLRSGKYQVKLGEGDKDLELSTAEFTLKRGDKEVVTIRRLPKKIEIAKVNPPPPANESVRVLNGHGDWVYALAFSPDGRWLASGSRDRTVRVWDARTGKLQHVLPQKASAMGLSFAPDNRTLAAASYGGGDGKAILWDAETGKQLDAIKLHEEGSLWDVTFSPDGKLLASGGTDKTAAIWDLKAGKLLRRLQEKDRVRRVHFTDGGKSLVTAGNELIVWDVESGKPKSSMPHLQTSSIKVSPDGSTLAAAHWGNRTISLFELASGKRTQFWTAHDTMHLNDITYSPNGKLLASGGHDGTVRLWKTADHTPVTTLRGHTGPVDAVQFSPDGKTLASGGVDDFTVRLWDVSAFGGANPR